MLYLIPMGAVLCGYRRTRGKMSFWNSWNIWNLGNIMKSRFLGSSSDVDELTLESTRICRLFIERSVVGLDMK